jgi:Alpha/beta hydrolase family
MDTLRRCLGWSSARGMVGTLLGAALVVGLAMLATGCGSDNTAANTTDPHWVRQANPHNKVAVVFVHGLFGDTDGTWTNANGESFFKLLKAAPGVGNQVDVFAFGFTSKAFGSGSLDIREAANMLEQSLQYSGVWDYPTVVFVAHSMGGLIVMREMVDNPAHREKVPLMMFYAVPQEGSQITAIAQHVVTNPAIRQMLMADHNDFLKQLSDDWGRVPESDKPTIICAYETVPLNSVMIVPWSSATRFCKGAPTAIEGTDHSTIVKPDRASHPSVVVLVNALRQYVFGAPNSPLLSTPDFVPDGDHWTYELTDPNGRNFARLVNDGDRKLDYTIERISDPRLMVLPEDTPKDIPAKHTDNLTLVLLHGTLQPEYSFTLSVPPLGDHVVMVHVKDMAAVQAKQDALTRDLTTRVAHFLASPDNVATLKRLPEQQQYAKIAAVADDSIAESAPDLPAAARWVVTADALSSLGLLAPANQALLNARQTSPRTATAPSAQLVASVISAQSGKPSVLKKVPDIAFHDEHGQAVFADATHVQVKVSAHPVPERLDANDVHAWSDLSAQLQKVPSLKAYGYTMQGDLAWARGDTRTAKMAYANASAIKPSPATAKKIEAVKLAKPSPAHH